MDRACYPFNCAVGVRWYWGSLFVHGNSNLISLFRLSVRLEKFTCVLACVCVVYCFDKCAHLTSLPLYTTHSNAYVSKLLCVENCDAAHCSFKVPWIACCIAPGASGNACLRPSDLPSTCAGEETSVGEYDCVLFSRGSVLCTHCPIVLKSCPNSKTSSNLVVPGSSSMKGRVR
jgi:hypothetical protein